MPIRITPEDRRLIAKVDLRRSKGMKWREIGNELGINFKTLQCKIARLSVEIDGHLVPKDQVSNTPSPN